MCARVMVRHLLYDKKILFEPRRHRPDQFAEIGDLAHGRKQNDDQFIATISKQVSVQHGSPYTLQTKLLRKDLTNLYKQYTGLAQTRSVSIIQGDLPEA